MSIRESFELRGEQRGERRGEKIGFIFGMIEVLSEFGKTETEIIHYLMTNEEYPLTKEQAEEALQNFRKRNQ